MEYVNPVKGMANQMIPMMVVLASFVGSVGGFIAMWLFQSLFLL